MPCQICEHTMQSLPSPEGTKQYWCYRCGTLRTVQHGFHDDSTPLLVRYARSMLIDAKPDTLRHAHLAGVIDACLLPKDRPEIPQKARTQ